MSSARRLGALAGQLRPLPTPTSAGSASEGAFSMLLQDRAAQSDAPSERTEQWEPAETALIVCDMWNLHHCLNATRRVRTTPHLATWHCPSALDSPCCCSQ